MQSAPLPQSFIALCGIILITRQESRKSFPLYYVRSYISCLYLPCLS